MKKLFLYFSVMTLSLLNGGCDPETIARMNIHCDYNYPVPEEKAACHQGISIAVETIKEEDIGMFSKRDALEKATKKAERKCHTLYPYGSPTAEACEAGIHFYKHALTGED